MKVGIPKEIYPHECRVAATPDTVEKMVKLGLEVVIEAGAGEEPLSEEEHIASPFPQWGQVERDHCQPVIEVVAEAPGSMTSGAPGSPPSRNCTEWVKWSLFVHVTVVPASTLIEAGTNLYDAGRSTVVATTGAAFVASAAQPPSMPRARATVATRIGERDRMATIRRAHCGSSGRGSSG